MKRVRESESPFSKRELYIYICEGSIVRDLCSEKSHGKLWFHLGMRRNCGLIVRIVLQGCSFAWKLSHTAHGMAQKDEHLYKFKHQSMRMFSAVSIFQLVGVMYTDAAGSYSRQRHTPVNEAMILFTFYARLLSDW